jgi:tetratricopeptide (TPR) repeat protein
MRPLLALPLTFTLLCAFSGLTGDEGHFHDLDSTQLGAVRFPVACKATVQKPFERGIALLHSFWYDEAEKQFLQIAKDDPNCGMAHWGVAMSLWHQLWEEPDARAISRGLAESEKAVSMISEQEAQSGDLPKDELAHEFAYASAISDFYSDSQKLDHATRVKRYSDDMKKVYESDSNDHEGAAFYALSLLACDESLPNRKHAAAILEKLFAIEPDHPGVAHYLIHSYDTPSLAHLGIPAARRYAQIAPAAPHALHMPSHIFALVGMWKQDIDSNLASIAATRKGAAMGLGNEEHQFHAMDFLVYAYLQSGHEDEAAKVIGELETIPHTQNMYGMNFDPHVLVQARTEASYALELHQWRTATSLKPVPGADPGINATIYLARAIGAARSDQLADAQKDIEEIRSIVKTLSGQDRKDEADFIERQMAIPLAWINHTLGKDGDAMGLLRPLADKETGSISATGFLPVHEHLADLLLDAKRPHEALVEYQTDLKLNPNRFDGLVGAALSAEQDGDHAKALEYDSLLLKACAGSRSVRPELARAKESLAPAQTDLRVPSPILHEESGVYHFSPSYSLPLRFLDPSAIGK